MQEIKQIISVVFIVWFSFLFILILGSLFSDFLPSSILLSVGFTLSDLNNIGGTFNIVTSFTGLMTLYLLFKAIGIQKSELEEVSSAMKSQEQQLRDQIEQSKESSRTDRTFKEIEKWNKVKASALKSLDSQEGIHSVSNYFT